MLERYPSYTVINYDALTYAGNLDNLEDIQKRYGKLPKRYYFVKGDVTDRLALRRVLRKHSVDAIVHFAAESHVDNSITKADDFIKTNIQGTYDLISVAREFYIERFVHISTDEVYGDVPRGSTHEDSPFRPSSPYSSSKASADLIVQSFVRTHRFPGIIVRGSNNFGTHQYPEKLIPAAITNLLEGKPVLMHGDGKQVRSWLHVDDFCDAIDLALHKASVGAIYNVAGTTLDNKSLVKKILKELHQSPSEGIRHVTDRPGGDRRYAPNDAKIRQELGWEARRPLVKYLSTVVEWYAENEKWWRKIKESTHFKSYDGTWQGLEVLRGPEYE